MKKIVCICAVTLITLFALIGCTSTDKGSSNTTAEVPTSKVVINFEGKVTAIDGEKITLENGKIIVISSDTVFAGDPDTGNTVSEEITVGNFIQGYTKDEPDVDQVSADKIYCNITE